MATDLTQPDANANLRGEDFPELQFGIRLRLKLHLVAAWTLFWISVAGPLPGGPFGWQFILCGLLVLFCTGLQVALPINAVFVAVTYPGKQTRRALFWHLVLSCLLLFAVWQAPALLLALS